MCGQRGLRCCFPVQETPTKINADRSQTRDVIWEEQGAFSPEFVEKNGKLYVLRDTAVDVEIRHENTFQGGDFGEIDIFVYKFGWIIGA